MNFPITPEAVIFDMDGLLIDTIPIYVEAMTAAGAEAGHPVTTDYLHSLIGLLGQELQDRLIHDFGPEFPLDAFLQKTGVHLQALLEGGAPLKAGARELIEFLSSSGVPLAVATSMKKHEAEHQLDQANLHRFFHSVVGRDNVARSKPHPDLYLQAAALLELPPPACVALEDSFNGIRSAHAAGCMILMVPDVLDPTDEIASLCVGVAGDLLEVKAALQSVVTR